MDDDVFVLSPRNTLCKATLSGWRMGYYLTIYDFGDIRYTVRRKGWEQYYVLSWSSSDQETPFAAIPYDDIRFLVLAWRALDSRFHPSQFYVLVGDTPEQVSLDNVNKHMSTQMLASHPIWCPVANMTSSRSPKGDGIPPLARWVSCNARACLP